MLLRIYISERSTAEVEFETSVLEKLSLAGLPVPSPLRTARGEFVQTDGARRNYAVLQFVEGRPMDEDALSDGMAASAGRFVAQMHEELRGFVPSGSKPDADLDFIERELSSLRELEGTYTGVRDLWPAARAHFDAREFEQGVVHADIHPGNIIVDGSGELRAVIDFDDSYWGTVVFDVAITAMAFSFRGPTEPDWRRAMVTVGAYGRTESTRPDDIYFGMIVNCVRFYVYTLPLTIEAGESADKNPFAQRALFLLDAHTKQGFRDAWADAGLVST